MLINLEDVLNKISNKKVLFITNKNSFTNNGFNKLLGSEDHTVFNDFSINPKLSEIKQACEKFGHESFDYIVGVGGGSPMDFAKTLHYFMGLKLENYNQYLEHIKSPTSDHIKTKLVLIPTTSGSGSEATHFSVVYDKNKKLSFADESLRANYVVLDPIFTKDLPPHITAYTGMDAIVHAIESFWSKNATIESKDHALNALRLLVPNIKEAVKNPTIINREAMAQGAYLAGQAIDISKTTAAHAFSYYLTSRYNIPHGQAVALMLPYFLIKNGNFPEINQIFKADNNKELKEIFTNLLGELELEMDIKNLIKDQNDFINSVNNERLKNNPVEFSKEELLDLFANE